MKKFIIKYDDGDDISTIWIMANNAQDAKLRAQREYHDIKSIISVVLA